MVPVKPKGHKQFPFDWHVPPFEHNNEPPAVQPTTLKLKRLAQETNRISLILQFEHETPDHPTVQTQVPFLKQIPFWQPIMLQSVVAAFH